MTGSNASSLRKYHLGCGDKRLEGYVNVDVRDTPAADVVLDLNEVDLGSGSAEVVFSHAFFEHLLRDRREAHLRSVRRALDAERGFACYLGLPDFRAVARLYLEGAPGIVGPRFDLYNVYRYTHGDPESAGDGYFEQLHKSLFDAEEVDALLTATGFPSYVVFNYVFPGEHAAVTLGFFATRESRHSETLQADCLEFLRDFDGEFLELGTISFVLFRCRPRARAEYLARTIKARRSARATASQMLAWVRARA